MREYCTKTMAISAMAVSMLLTIAGCVEPMVDAPKPVENGAKDERLDQTPLPQAAIAEQGPADAAPDVSRQPVKKSVVNSLLRAVTKGVAEALDEEMPGRPQTIADSPAGD